MALTLRKFVPARPASQSEAQMAEPSIGMAALAPWGGHRRGVVTDASAVRDRAGRLSLPRSDRAVLQAP